MRQPHCELTPRTSSITHTRTYAHSEWDRDEALNHSADAVAAMQALSDFLVRLADLV
jgi:hypothetical protein